MSSVTQDVAIRPATRADIPDVLTLWKLLQDTNAAHEPRLKLNSGAVDWFDGFLQTQMDNDNMYVMVAVRNDEVVGYIFGQIITRLTLDPTECGYVADICVRSGMRGQGIGRQLFSQLRHWFASRGVTDIEVQVVGANPASQAFWRKMGFGEFLRTLRSDLT